MLYSNYFQIALVHLNSEVSRNQNPIATSFFHLIGIKDTDALIGSAVQTSFFFSPRHVLVATRLLAQRLPQPTQTSKTNQRCLSDLLPRHFLACHRDLCATLLQLSLTQPRHIVILTIFFTSLEISLMPASLCHYFYPYHKKNSI